MRQARPQISLGTQFRIGGTIGDPAAVLGLGGTRPAIRPGDSTARPDSKIKRRGSIEVSIDSSCARRDLAQIPPGLSSRQA